MNFILYFLLRKFFVNIDFSDNSVIIEKGIFLKRSSVIPESSIVKISLKRGIIVRAFRACEVKIFTLNGTLTFFLKKDERFPLLPESFPMRLKPRFRDIMFGAFIDTRALGGILIFTTVLRRIGKLFGGEYLRRVISAISDTAERLNKILSFLNIAVPQIAALIAVFMFGAWTLAYIRKLLRLSRFQVGRSENILRVQSGLFTLYDSYIYVNSAVFHNTLTTLIYRRAPLYSRDVMICPCVRRKKLAATLKTLCGLSFPEGEPIQSPKSAFFGYCAAPLSWSGAFAIMLVLVYRLTPPRYAMLVKTLLYGGLFASLYSAAVYLYYMKYSGMAVGENYSLFAFRSNMRLYQIVSLNNIIVNIAISQNPFQRKSRLCNFKSVTENHERLNARQLPVSISKQFAFRSN